LKITYTPRDDKPQVYEYDSDDMLMSEVTAIEKAAGTTLEIVELHAQAGGMTERLILLWACMRQSNPFLRLGQLESTVRKSELLLEFSPKDREALRERVRKSRVSDQEKAAVYDQLDADEAEQAAKAAEAVQDEGPKDESLSP